MGGAATFTGTDFQASAIAYVMSHIVADRYLGWFPDSDDRPVRVAGETGGPGDDFRIEFGERRPAVEVQAKFGLRSPAEFVQVLKEISARGTAASDVPVVVVVDPLSHNTITKDFARDVLILDAGRTDYSEKFRELLRQNAELEPLLRRSRIEVLDLDGESAAHKKEAEARLELLFADNPELAAAAWKILFAKGSEVCKNKVVFGREDLTQFLIKGGLTLSPASPESFANRLLDQTKALLDAGSYRGALAFLMQVRPEMEKPSIGARTRARYALQLGVANLRVGRVEEAERQLQRATELDPSLPHPWVNLGAVALRQGKHDLARAALETAISLSSDDPNAWSLRLRLDSESGKPPKEPPTSVASSAQYIVAQSEIATQRGEYQHALDLAEKACDVAPTSAVAQAVLAKAALDVSLGSPQQSRQTSAERARTAATLALLYAPAEDDEIRLRAMLARSEAKLRLGDNVGAAEDLSAAESLRASDKAVVAQKARQKFLRGELEAAALALDVALTDDDALLCTMRAVVNAARGNTAAARSDITRALSLATGTPDEADVALQLSDAALQLNDVPLAETLVGRLPDDAKDFRVAVQRSRLAAHAGNWDAQTKHAEAALALVSADVKPAILLQLADTLVDLGQTERASVFLRRVLLSELPDRYTREYARLLRLTRDGLRIQELLEAREQKGALPSWALRLKGWFAHERQDVAGQIGVMEALLVNEELDFDEKVDLARLYASNDRSRDAISLLASMSVIQRAPDARSLMQAASAYFIAGDLTSAIEAAAFAYRLATNDAELVAAFISLVLSADKVDTPEPTIVGPNTVVRVKTDEGESLEFYLFDDGPVDSKRGEFLIGDVAVQPMLGLTAGDSWTKGEGTWLARKYTVTEVRAAFVGLFQYALSNFEHHFPEQRLVRGFKIDEDLGLRDFARFVSATHARNEAFAKAREVYAAHGLPLPALAKVLGVPTIAVYQAITQSPEWPQLAAEWTPADLRAESTSNAIAATRLVLTRSAVATLHALRLWNLLTRYELVAPISLTQEIKLEIAQLEADKVKATGRMGLSPDGRLTLTELTPAAFDVAINEAKEQLTEITSRATVRLRPIASIAGSADDDGVRQLLGSSAVDALALAHFENGVLIADDLGLRRLEYRGTRVVSTSSIALVYALNALGILSGDGSHRMLLELQRRRIAAIVPSAELLAFLLTHIEDYTAADVRTTFESLTIDGISLADATTSVAKSIRAVVGTDITRVSVSSVVAFALQALSTKWPADAVKRELIGGVKQTLALAPMTITEVERACREWRSSN